MPIHPVRRRAPPRRRDESDELPDDGAGTTVYAPPLRDPPARPASPLTSPPTASGPGSTAPQRPASAPSQAEAVGPAFLSEPPSIPRGTAALDATPLPTDPVASPPPVPLPSEPTDEAGRSAARERSRRYAWGRAIATVERACEALLTACGRELPERRALVDAVSRRLRARLQGVEEGLFSASPEAQQRALAVLERLVADDPQVRSLERNPLCPVDLRGPLRGIVAAFHNLADPAS